MKNLTGRIGSVLSMALLGGLTGCTTYVSQPRPREVYSPPAPVYVPPPTAYAPPPPPVYAPPPAVYAPPSQVRVEASLGSVDFEVNSEEDFYEPLSPYGRWQVIGSYGRCWLPSRVEGNWRPYCNGNWQRTDAGWYWASDEPWAWATYHYGRWDLSAQFGWYWVPQTQWAPAWVSWHEGGGYVGWAPLQPSSRFSGGGSVSVNVALIAPRAFVFVEPRSFLQPVRPATVVVNNTTIINKTVNITNVKVVNNTVINEGPRTQIIEQASGKKVQAMPVRELRRKQEADVVARRRVAAPAREKNDPNFQTPVRTDAAPRETKPEVNAQPESETRERAHRIAKELETRQAEAERRANQAAAASGEETAKAKESAPLEESRTIAREEASQAETARRAKEAVTVQEAARARESEVIAQEASQKAAREQENKNRLQSERKADEAAATQGKASEAIARESGNAQEAQRIAQPASEQRGKAAAKKAPAKPELRPKSGQAASEQGGTNTVKKAKKGKGKASPPEKAPAAPPTPL